MDLYKQISSVVDLNDYIELTQDVAAGKHKDVKIVINMSTILCLKRIRSLEVEYFNKCDGSGAAFSLFERMLSSPASKTWGLLGSGVVGLIQYWLDAVRKHLISHHIHWWMFLRQILFFIKELRLKDQSLSSVLVKGIAESMLDLATSGKPDVSQRYEILHTFNLFCAESSREIRLTLKTKSEPYFIRLATIMATCGHLPSQLAALEALLRWLQPRHDPATRRDAAAKWFPPHLYPKPSVDVFLNRSWMNFFQDARDFLNSHNETKNLITSVICRKLSVGETIIISGEERRQSWLDINSGSQSVTVVLDPQLLEALGASNVASCETLTIDKHSAKLVKLYRESTEVRILIETVSPPCIVPSRAELLQPGDVIIVLSSRSNMPRVDAALRAVFEDKYLVSMDVESTALSPPRAEGVHTKTSMDNPRFSHVNAGKEKRRRPQCGVAWAKRYSAQQSPSTASTRSLAQLHDKLANLPYYEFTKEPVSVCAEPELSIVNEQSETQISNSIDSDSTLKLRRCAVRNFRAHLQDIKSKSDTEVRSEILEAIPEQNEENRSSKGSQSEKYVKRKIYERNVSSLLSVTIGSADDSIINATIERLPKDKEINTDNLVDLLVQEALQSKGNEENQRQSDSGINTGDVKSQEQNIQNSETIEDTQYTGIITRTKTPAGLRNIKGKTSTNVIVSKSTSDESNTEAVIETPISFVSVRKRNQRKKSVSKKDTEKSDEMTTFDNKEVEDFFSQHFAENQMGDVIISPSLAKKINDSTTSSSNEFLMKDIDDNFDIRNEELLDLDIVECLNDIVDKVCSDLDKCSEYLDKYGADTKILNISKKNKISSKGNIPLEETGTLTDEPKEEENRKSSKNTKSIKKQTIKLKFTSKNKKAKPKTKGKLKFVEPVSKMSTILEDNNESDANKTVTSDAKKISPDNNMKTPLARKKRKLYSPKDDEVHFNRSNNEDSSNKPDIVPNDSDDDIALAEFKKDKDVTPKPSTSCYKEIEKERKYYKRVREHRLKNVQSPPSPKTKRLDEVFEKLKDNIEVHKNEKIILVDKKSDKDFTKYNFTSDSDDEDFKQKKIEVQKRTSTTTIGSGTSIISTRRGRVRNKPKYIEDGTESDKETAKPAKRKRATKRNVSKKSIKQEVTNLKCSNLEVDRPTNLIDEKMREAPPEELNTSFVEVVVDNNEKAPEPSIKPPELEAIPDENVNIDVKGCKEKVTQKQKTSRKYNNKEAIKDELATSKKQDEKRATKVSKKGIKIDKIAAKQPEKDTILKDDDRTISPLPGLVIETEKNRNEMEDSITTNVLRKFQKIFKEGPDALNDTITTQNMLSENEKVNSSPHNMNISEEMGKIFGDDSSSNSKNNKKPKTSDLKNKENSDINIIDDTINSDQTSKISKAESSKSKKQNKLTLKFKDKTDSSVNSTSAKEHFASKTKNIKSKSQQINESQKSKTKSIKSHIDEINCDIDTEIVTPSIPKCRSRSQEIELVNITTDSEVNSERSIATDGITGHGELNELPPSPKLLRENLSPREIQDMDPTIRQYYIELSSKVNNSKRSSESRKNIHDRNEKVKTKAIQRVVEEDSDSELVQKSDEEKRYKFEDREYDLAKMLPSRRETESESSSQSSKKALSVSITRLSSKEISKWLPSMKTTPESSFKSAQKNEKSLKQSVRTTKNIISKETTVESSFETAEKIQKSPETSPRAVVNRKSQISPIILEDFMINRRCKDESTDTQNNEMVSMLDTIAKKYFTHESSPNDSAASEDSAPRSASKRKSPVSKQVEAKKRKLEKIETVDISESRQSSNVADWLKNTSATSEVDNSDATRDVLQNLMEKLDTTLVEIHQNTTKDFINLFVDVQKQLSEEKEERCRMYRETAVNILSNVTQLIDRQFAQIDQQAEERSNKLMSLLKTRAAEVLRRDCTRKRAMVTILRDDVQAVVDHLDHLASKQ